MFSFVLEPVVEALPESPGTVALLAIECGPAILDEFGETAWMDPTRVRQARRESSPAVGKALGRDLWGASGRKGARCSAFDS